MYKDRLEDLSSSLENLDLARHSKLPPKEARLNDLGATIFHALYSQRRWAKQHIQNIYETLTRGRIDIRSIVGHWKARNKE